MSKGLEALKRIKSRYNDRVCIDILEDFDTIEKELKEHEQHKAIEKEFSINLNTVFAALRNDRIYARNPYGFDTDTKIVKVHGVSIEKDRICGSFSLPSELFNHAGWKLADYGKTWALTKEEVEK